MAYEYVPYPKWLYHASEKPVVVNNEDEHAELGEGWEDSPAAFLPPEPSEPSPDDPSPEPNTAAKKRGRKPKAEDSAQVA